MFLDNFKSTKELEEMDDELLPLTPQHDGLRKELVLLFSEKGGFAVLDDLDLGPESAGYRDRLRAVHCPVWAHRRVDRSLCDR